MQAYLKHYNLRITALSPIHVGNGQTIGKKEYIQIGGPKKPVIIPDMNKMFLTLLTLRREKAYEDFILKERNLGLGQWLLNQGITESTIESFKSYSMDPGDAFVRLNSGKSATPKKIVSFTKDAYLNPYIPGSTIKGMIRNALLCYRVHNARDRYRRYVDELQRASGMGGKPETFLEKETKNLENAVFNTLERDEANPANAVNSIMSGLIVSDSKPIDNGKLILAQKIDLSLRGEEKPLPLLREALRPGTQIEFELTIDTRLCDVTIEEILNSLEFFNQVSFDSFYGRFGRGSKAKGTVWIGGGTGFLSKTILYPVYGDKAVRIADKAFQATIGKNYDVHKHFKDVPNGVAPHVCKCTRFGGKLYDMGMGKIEVIN